MPLIKSVLKSQIQLGISNDPILKTKFFQISKKAMDRFQSAQKQALINAGSSVGFAAAQQVASIAFAKELQKLQDPIGDAVGKYVADGVDSYIKLAQVIITPPLISTPAAIGAPVTIPVIPPGKII